VYKEFVKLPGVLRVLSRGCLMHREGSGRKSRICELESRDFEQKSVIKAWYAMSYEIISRSFGWSESWGGPRMCN